MMRMMSNLHRIKIMGALLLGERPLAFIYFVLLALFLCGEHEVYKDTEDK